MDKFEPLAVISYALKNRKVSEILTYLLSKVGCKIVLFQFTYMIRFFWTVFAFTLCSFSPVVTSLGVFIEKQSSFLAFK